MHKECAGDIQRSGCIVARHGEQGRRDAEAAPHFSRAFHNNARELALSVPACGGLRPRVQLTSNAGHRLEAVTLVCVLPTSNKKKMRVVGTRSIRPKAEKNKINEMDNNKGDKNRAKPWE